ncbi:MAG: hypothetical protein AAF550_02980, partial [Myxococcota bacterium]
DMTTDGGGFTQVISWDGSGGDNLEDFTNSMVADTANTMGLFRFQVDRIEWNDGGVGTNTASGDVLAYSIDIDVPNTGSVLYSLNYTGVSMESSGTWIYATTATSPSTLENLDCWDDASGGNGYSASELGWIPSYTCPNTEPELSTITWSWRRNEVVRSLSAGVQSFHIRSLHRDLGDCCELSILSSFALWVR